MLYMTTTTTMTCMHVCVLYFSYCVFRNNPTQNSSLENNNLKENLNATNSTQMGYNLLQINKTQKNGLMQFDFSTDTIRFTKTKIERIRSV